MLVDHLFTRFMAPPPSIQNPHHTMSASPNVAALMLAKKHKSKLLPQTNPTIAKSDTTAAFTTIKTITIGKDHRSVNITPLPSCDSVAWKKASAFQDLQNITQNLLDSSNVADIIAMIAAEVPADTNRALRDAQEVVDRLKSSMLQVQFLDPVQFLDGSGEDVHVANETLASRPSGITFFRFSCQFDPGSLDTCINQDPLQFNFCLKLPIHEFDKQSGTVQRTLSSPQKGAVSPPKGQAQSKKDSFLTANRTLTYNEQEESDHQRYVRMS